MVLEYKNFNSQALQKQNSRIDQNVLHFERFPKMRRVQIPVASLLDILPKQV